MAHQRHTFEPHIDVTKPFSHKISAPFGIFSVGDWLLSGGPRGTAGEFNLSLSWTGARSAAAPKLALALYNCAGKRIRLWRLPLVLQQGSRTFPAYAIGAQTWILGYSGNNPQAYARLSVQGQVDYAPNLSVATDLASLLSLHPNDVRFYFPASNRELFANAELLKASSPYFAALLGTDFAEGQKIAPADRTIRSTSTVNGGGSIVGFSDSDEEGDSQLGGTAQQGDFASNTPFHDVVVNNFAHKTYTAVLLYLKSGHIEFGNISSASAPAFDTSQVPTQLNAPARPFSNNSSILPSVSPKSVYRLAHFLTLTDLSNLALAVFKEQLTVENIALRLFTKFAASFPEVGDMLVNFAVENWKEVKESQAMKEMILSSEKEGGELPRGIALKLMMRLA